ncbi:MAG: PH domain-containing protein [Planctomycetota bacterium]
MSTQPDNHEQPVETERQPQAESSDAVNVEADPSEGNVDEATATETARVEPTVDSPSDSDESRLHPSTVWLPATETMINTIVPFVIASFFVGPIGSLMFFGLFVWVPVLIYYIVRYRTVAYRIAGDEVIIKSGLLSKRERRIPFDRVQEVEIHKSVLHRIIGCAKVNLSTAGSDTKEAALNVLTTQAADVLKRSVSDKQRVVDPTSDDDNVEDVSDYAYALDLKTLIYGGLSSKVVATIGAVLSTIAYFQLFVGVGSDWMSRFSKQVEEKTKQQIPGPETWKDWEPDLPDTGVLGWIFSFWTDETLPKSILLVVLGLGVAVAAYVVRYYAYRLRRADDLLSTSYGLLTYRHGTLSRDRIQALKLEESLMRRWFGLAAVRVDSAGDNTQVDENKNRDVLVPVARLADAEEVARQAIPGLNELTPIWKKISPIAIKRGSKKGWLIVAVAMIQTYFFGGWYCLMWLPAFPFVYLLNRKWYQHMGYWNSDDYLLVRKGWINRATFCVPTRNIQSVIFEQNFFDRRLKLASLSVDIAGQSNTGGGPRIRHLPVETAIELQRELVDNAAACEFRW